MAYISQDTKAKLAPTIKAILKKYGVKGSLSIRNHMSLVLTLKSGEIDFIENYIATDANKHYGQPMSADQVAYIRKNGYLDVNTYWIDAHYTGKAKDFLTEMKAAMEGPDFFNNDDIQTDYFSRSHYVDILIGKYDKPYIAE
jgi:ABC-type proline/glycine betaine transport system substrate-binding protein